MADRKLSVKDKTAAAAFVLVLGISSIMGAAERKNAPAPEKRSIADVKETTETTPVASRGEERAPQVLVLVLDQGQAALAGSIMEALKEGKPEQAARIMSREEEALEDMFYTTMKGTRYFYDGERLSRETEGQGMVFTKAGTVYYGSFRDGKPDGPCTALQVVNLEAPRYNYSQGNWKDGQMNGPGHTGYCYYENSPEGEARDICKSGTFSGDFLDGEVVYTSMNQEDGSSTWKFTVDRGTMVLDDRWQYGKSTGEYQLLSEENDNHAYVVGEGQIDLPVWKNLLVWDE